MLDWSRVTRYPSWVILRLSGMSVVGRLSREERTCPIIGHDFAKVPEAVVRRVTSRYGFLKGGTLVFGQEEQGHGTSPRRNPGCGRR